MFSVVAGPVDPDSVGDGSNVPGIVAGTETGILALTVNELLVEQVEVREGDTYTMCVSGSPTEHTVHQIHLSQKSSNKPDFTFYEWHPQASTASTVSAT